MAVSKDGENMRTSLTFKPEEEYMWSFINTKVNARVFIKELIVAEMERLNILEDYKNENKGINK